MGYGCGPTNTYIARRYWSRDERRTWLQDYASQLENELKAVRERIDELAKDTEE